uniref:Uncharacterized protein n=1 Tax=Chromera velia CCMP2878 TaxID=1169474 RepID=A0A0G4F7I8_9ALVE|eukprot:Cvel_15542.t1-p1 / transcript=Cvel_15542.t1 / gene=Cvel_15542 / organism=Chromera_velia_CCMP2878 / gene_product=Ankyrin repeat domain-containing protein 65, putative / transcript_product=Ankyrin repeat domain-containing protein 65, putative / location=Cvel_scaffold1154:50007-51149(-) / protein_length=381 / sequence_SO=supercontig / SO=protein_coding / is_pseudo=false
MRLRLLNFAASQDYRTLAEVAVGRVDQRRGDSYSGFFGRSSADEFLLTDHKKAEQRKAEPLDLRILELLFGSRVITPALRSAPLLSAIAAGHEEMAVKLLNWGAHVDGLPQGSLSSEVEGSASSLHIAVKVGNPRLVRLLIERGANVWALARDGRTVLHSLVAEQTGVGEPRGKEAVEIAQMLLSAGRECLMSCKDEKGVTPIHLAAVASNGNFSLHTLHFLLGRVATARRGWCANVCKGEGSVDVRDSEGATPLLWVVRKIRNLGEKCSDLQGRQCLSLTVAAFMLLHWGADASAEDNRGRDSESPLSIIQNKYYARKAPALLYLQTGGGLMKKEETQPVTQDRRTAGNKSASKSGAENGIYGSFLGGLLENVGRWLFGY